MAWFLSPSGWPTSADDGSLFAASLHARGWQILDSSQVQAAIDAYKAGQAFVPDPPDYVNEDEFPARLAAHIEEALPARLSEAELGAAFDPAGAAAAAVTPESVAANLPDRLSDTALRAAAVAAVAADLSDPETEIGGAVPRIETHPDGYPLLVVGA